MLNVGYQAFSTAGSSILSNVILGDDPFTFVNIGVGDFNIPLRNGKFSLNPIDNLGNFTSLFSYGRGFVDVARGNSTFEFNKLTLSPIFRETSASQFGVNPNDLSVDPSNKGTVTRMLDRATDIDERGRELRPSGLQQNGVSFFGK